MSGDSELRILVNPQGMNADIGVRFLTRCFGTRWTEAMYRWYLQRVVGLLVHGVPSGRGRSRKPGIASRTFWRRARART